MSDFDRCIQFVLDHEGGYVFNPLDPGGETKYGISKKAYPMLDIKNISLADAKLIYERDYWGPAGCEALPWPMNLVMLDTAVNCGVHKAIQFRDVSLNHIDVIMLRIAHYNQLDKPAFMKGWINRVLDLYKTCKGEEHPLTMNFTAPFPSFR